MLLPRKSPGHLCLLRTNTPLESQSSRAGRRLQSLAQKPCKEAPAGGATDPHLAASSFCLSSSVSTMKGLRIRGCKVEAVESLSRVWYPCPAQHQCPSCIPMLPMHVVRGSSFTASSLESLPHPTAPPSHSGSSVTISTGLSAGVGVLESPGLHSRDEEVLRAEGLVVESVAVARAAPIQVAIDVESLAAPSTCRMLSQWLPLCLVLPWRCSPPAPEHLHLSLPQPC